MSNDRFVLLYQFPFSFKILFTAILAILALGYIAAIVQVFEVHSGRDGEAGLSSEDIKLAYHGNRNGSRLESALNGPMQGMLSDDERMKIVSWIHGGKKENFYTSDIAPIVESRCVGCHNGSTENIPDFTKKEQLLRLAETDEGISVMNLIRVSHIHLFGLAFIFSLLGMIFCFTHTNFPKVKYTILCIPFVAIFLDIASWWLTKEMSDAFAYVVILGGALMGVSFFYQWCASFYQIWIFRCDKDFCPIQ